MNQPRFAFRPGSWPAASWSWLVFASVVSLTGCEADQPGVPPASTGSVFPQTEKKETPLRLGLVLTEAEPSESSYFETFLRAYAGRDNVILAVARAKPGEQAQAIRDLSDEPLSAMIVVPDMEKPPTDALSEARELGIPLVLLGHTLKTDPPIPSVVFQPPGPAAKEIVSAVVKAAKDQGFADDAPALMLVDQSSPANQERARVLREALSATAHSRLPDLVLDSPTTSEVTEAVRAAVQEHKDLAIILANEDEGLHGTAAVRDGQHGKQPLVSIGGFFTNQGMFKDALDDAYAALGDVDSRALVERAYEEALQLAKGEKVPDLSEVEVKVRHPLRPGPRETPEPKVPEDLSDTKAQSR